MVNALLLPGTQSFFPSSLGPDTLIKFETRFSA